MFERMTIGRSWRHFVDQLACAVTAPMIAVLLIPLLAIEVGASAYPIRHAGKDGGGNQDVTMVLQLALQSSRQRLRVERQKCDVYAANAERDDVASVVALANCFKNGVGRPKSLLRAKRYFDAAAARGSAAAHLALGQFYRDGRVVSRDLRQTTDHLSKAAEAGLPAAMVEYGLVLLRMKEDGRVACDWFERAAEAGERNGVRLLGDCHARAIGGRSDRSRARKLYRQAALLGDRTALLKLTGHVFKGIGSDIAAAEGCDWASEAAARDNQAASVAFAYCLSVIR
jgi:TPR repeat protein